MVAATGVVDPVVEPRRCRSRSILALARVEAGRMLRHPVFLIGLVATVAVVLGRPSGDWAGDGRFGATTQGIIVAAAISTLLSSALIAGRQRFVSDPDLFPATPATPSDRVLATGLGLLGPALVITAVVAAIGVRTALADGFEGGQDRYTRAIIPSWAEWVQPALLVMLAGVVGISVAHLRRGRLGALLFVAIVFFVGGTAALWVAQVHPVFRAVHPVMSPEYERRLPEAFTPSGWVQGDPPLRAPDEESPRWREVHTDASAVGWHLVYLSGLILLVLWVATRMADRDEPSGNRWLIVAAIPLVLVGGVTPVLIAGANP